MTSPSLLFREIPGPREARERDEDRSFARDLNLDQVVAAIAGDREERDLITETLFGHLRDANPSGTARRSSVIWTTPPCSARSSASPISWPKCTHT